MKTQISGGGLQKGGYQQVAGCWDWMPCYKKQKAGQRAGQKAGQKAGCWEGMPCYKQKGGREAVPQKIQLAQLPLPSFIGMPPHLKRKRVQLQEMAQKTNRSTANPSYGWSLRSPQKGRERHTLMSKCGSACFLLPKKEGFPVCAKYDLNPKCSVDCGGVLSAYRRARQYKNEDVAKSAKSLAKRIKCSWTNAKI